MPGAWAGAPGAAPACPAENLLPSAGERQWMWKLRRAPPMGGPSPGSHQKGEGERMRRGHERGRVTRVEAEPRRPPKLFDPATSNDPQESCGGWPNIVIRLVYLLPRQQKELRIRNAYQQLISFISFLHPGCNRPKSHHDHNNKTAIDYITVLYHCIISLYCH